MVKKIVGQAWQNTVSKTKYCKSLKAFESKTKGSLKLVDTGQNNKALVICNWANNVKINKNNKFVQSTTVISILEIIIPNLQSIIASLVSLYDSCGRVQFKITKFMYYQKKVRKVMDRRCHIFIITSQQYLHQYTLNFLLEELVLP